MKNSWARKLISCVTLAAFIVLNVGQVYAQMVQLPVPGAMVNVSPAVAPPVLKGVQVDPKQPFKFDFILDAGNQNFVEMSHAASLQEDAMRLIRYFLASLTIPEKDLWVNLSPYEKDRIIPDEFSMTEMGRDLLAQDYILKQITASLVYPESETGKTFWARVYEAAYQKYGTTDVPVDTFNKVWIVPDKASVYENGTKAFVTKATLKVMLETDYVAASCQREEAESRASARDQMNSAPTTELAKDVIRQVVIPILEKEVNEGANFAQLRQVYYSLILAKWYKETLKDSIINRKYSDQKKTGGVDLADKDDRQQIYEKYLEAFRKGAFNYVKEEYDTLSQETIPRKYFSGGMDFAQKVHLERTRDASMLSKVGAVLLIMSTFVSNDLKAVDTDNRIVTEQVADSEGSERALIEQIKSLVTSAEALSVQDRNQMADSLIQQYVLDPEVPDPVVMATFFRMLSLYSEDIYPQQVVSLLMNAEIPVRRWNFGMTDMMGLSLERQNDETKQHVVDMLLAKLREARSSDASRILRGISMVDSGDEKIFYQLVDILDQWAQQGVSVTGDVFGFPSSASELVVFWLQERLYGDKVLAEKLLMDGSSKSPRVLLQLAARSFYSGSDAALRDTLAGQQTPVSLARILPPKCAVHFTPGFVSVVNDPYFHQKTSGLPHPEWYRIARDIDELAYRQHKTLTPERIRGLTDFVIQERERLALKEILGPGKTVFILAYEDDDRGVFSLATTRKVVASTGVNPDSVYVFQGEADIDKFLEAVRTSAEKEVTILLRVHGRPDAISVGRGKEATITAAQLEAALQARGAGKEVILDEMNCYGSDFSLRIKVPGVIALSRSDIGETVTKTYHNNNSLDEFVIKERDGVPRPLTIGDYWENGATKDIFARKNDYYIFFSMDSQTQERYFKITGEAFEGDVQTPVMLALNEGETSSDAAEGLFHQEDLLEEKFSGRPLDMFQKVPAPAGFVSKISRYFSSKVFLAVVLFPLLFAACAKPPSNEKLIKASALNERGASSMLVSRADGIWRFESGEKSPGQDILEGLKAAKVDWIRTILLEKDGYEDMVEPYSQVTELMGLAAWGNKDALKLMMSPEIYTNPGVIKYLLRKEGFFYTYNVLNRERNIDRWIGQTGRQGFSGLILRKAADAGNAEANIFLDQVEGEYSPYLDVYEILVDEISSGRASGLPLIELHGLARAISRNMPWDMDITRENVLAGWQEVREGRNRVSSQAVFSSGTNVVMAVRTIDDQKEYHQMESDLRERVGVKNIRYFSEDIEKSSLLESLQQPGPTTFYVAADGNPDDFSLEDGGVAVRYQDLGDVLLQREKRFGSTSDFVLVYNVCFGKTFVYNLIEYLQEHGARTFPVIIVTTDADETTFGGDDVKDAFNRHVSAGKILVNVGDIIGHRVRGEQSLMLMISPSRGRVIEVAMTEPAGIPTGLMNDEGASLSLTAVYPGAGSVDAAEGYFDFWDEFADKKVLELNEMDTFRWLAGMANWFGTNETDWPDSLKPTQGRQGVYLGTAYGGQNFSRLAHGDFDLAVIIDINPFVAAVYMPLRAALMTHAQSRAEFLALLSGVTFSPEELALLKDASLENIYQAIRQKLAGMDEGMRLENMRMAQALAASRFVSDKKVLFEKFWAMYFENKVQNGRVLSQIRSSMDSDKSWLANEKNFLKIRKMTQEGRILGVTGSWTDAGLIDRLKGRLKDRRLDVTTVYISNIVEKIDRRDIPALYRNAVALLDGKEGLLIENRMGRKTSVSDIHQAGFLQELSGLIISQWIRIMEEDDGKYYEDADIRFADVIARQLAMRAGERDLFMKLIQDSYEKSIRDHIAEYPFFMPAGRGNDMDFLVQSLRGAFEEVKAKNREKVEDKVWSAAEHVLERMERLASAIKDPSRQTDLKGGIDFNSDRMSLERQGRSAALEWGDAAQENIEINGLVPVIMKITPIESLPQFMS